jgi:hypothetical protein
LCSRALINAGKKSRSRGSVKEDVDWRTLAGQANT